jgi:hypothetical protein
LSTLTLFKNKEASGSEVIIIEPLKQVPLTVLVRLLDFIDMFWRTGHVPEEWLPMYIRKGER